MSDVDKPTTEAGPGDQPEADNGSGIGDEAPKKADRPERAARPARKRKDEESAPPPPHPLEAPLKARFGERLVGFEAVKGYCAPVVAPGELLGLCRELKEDSGYNHLRCLTGLDRGAQLEVAYNLMNMATKEELVLKVKLDRDAPSVPSLCPLWKTANWLERETYDLLGIVFEGHPDLRRILLPEDWEGHPLRKDYDYRRD